MRVVFTTFGSLGDLHPYIAMAIEWNGRGHDAVIATSENYRQTIESEGIEFAPVRPELPDLSAQSGEISRIMNMKSGPEYLIRRVMMPWIRESFDDLSSACAGADAIVGHPLAFATPLVAHVRQMPWAYVAIAPAAILSAYDPPRLAPAPWTNALPRTRPLLYTLLFRLVRMRLRGWFAPVRELSKALGTYPLQRDPMGADQFSPWLNLALFSSVLAAPQPDWPANTALTGFAFYDKHSADAGLSMELCAFLDRGEPPVAFTLGSAAVNDPGSFYRESATAVKLLRKRAVLLTGRGTRNHEGIEAGGSIHVSDYASYSELFPRCAAVVHQGGVGTTAQALRAGKSMLVMPYAFDQPDNGARAMRIGVARMIDRRSYTAISAARELSSLLDVKAGYARRADTVGRLVRMENGAKSACDTIEGKLLAY